MKAVVIVVCVLTGISGAFWPNEQHDWSGGPGNLGPEWQFDDTFYSSMNIDWSDTPGFLYLAPSDDSPGADYVESGSLISMILHIPMGTDLVEWGDIYWESVEPQGTTVCFQLRVGYNWQSMLPWGDTVFVSGTNLAPLLPDDVFYVQYRAILITDDPQVTPVLDTIVIEGWWPGAVGSEALPLSQAPLLTVTPNPSFDGEMTFSTGPGIHGHAELTVFDSSGRVVDIPISGTIAGQSVSSAVSGLPAGVYTAVLKTGTESASVRAVVIRRR